MKRHYETCVVYDGTLPEETIAKEKDSLQALLSSASDFEKVEEWGKRSLAYEIKRKRNGVYFLFVFDGDDEVPAKIDKHFKLNTSVLRYMTTLRDPNKPLKPKPREERKDEAEANESTPVSPKAES